MTDVRRTERCPFCAEEHVVEEWAGGLVMVCPTAPKGRIISGPVQPVWTVRTRG